VQVIPLTGGTGFSTGRDSYAGSNYPAAVDQDGLTALAELLSAMFLSWEEIGTSTFAIRALAGLANGTAGGLYWPGSTGHCRTALGDGS